MLKSCKPGVVSNFFIFTFIFISVLCVVPISLSAQNTTFAKRTYIGQSSKIHADLNSDGREDFVYVDAAAGGFFVQLSAGNGVYASPTKYVLPNAQHVGAIVIGDFNSDSKADLIVFAFDHNFYEYLNNGDGTFREQAAFLIGDNVGSAAVGDFNHDGRMDVAFLITSTLHVWFGNGDGGFRVGPSTPVTSVDTMMVGDYDGDGKADIAIASLFPDDNVQVLYGDGTGHFPVTNYVRRAGEHIRFSAGDVNGDGKMDIMASSFYPAVPDRLFVYYGNASRSWTATQIHLQACAYNNAGPTAVDINGDGINDLVVPETNCDGSGVAMIDVLTRNSNGTYNAEQGIYWSPSSSLALRDLTVLRADRNTKPDLSLSQCTATPCIASTDYELQVLLNTTVGKFPTCTPPNSYEGIHVCSPLAGGTVTSPVGFRIGVAGEVPMRKVEVWVDGHKVVEQIDGFSNYTFMDRSVTLAKGSHQVVIYAAGWDNWLEKTSFSRNVN
jgi:VCBS repeat protein